MALPLVPLLIGAAAGAAITYVLVTRNSRNPVSNAARDLADTVEGGASRVSSAVSGAVGDATEAVKKATNKVAS